MNHYELFAIISGQHADSEIEGITGQLQELLAKHHTTIHFSQNLGRRKLCYPIKHQHHGTYMLFEFDAEPQEIKKIDRLLKLTSEVLRFCLIKRKTVGKPITLERKEEDQRTPTRTERPASPRKTLGEELLGDAPGISDEPEVTPVAEEPVLEPEAPTPQEEVPETPVAPVTIAPKIASEESLESTPSEDSSSSRTAKKVQKKVSYEELDKKLNELLSDDII